MLTTDVINFLRTSGVYLILSELGEPCEHMVAYYDHLITKGYGK